MDEINDDFRLPIDEDSDGLCGGGELFANSPGVGGRNGARGFFVKIQTDGVGAEFFGKASILRASDAADLYFGHDVPKFKKKQIPRLRAAKPEALRSE